MERCIICNETGNGQLLKLRAKGSEGVNKAGKARGVTLVVGWLVVLRINVDLAIFQPYLDLEAGDNQSLKIQGGEAGNRTPSSCSAIQELNHSAIAAPVTLQDTLDNGTCGFYCK